MSLEDVSMPAVGAYETVGPTSSCSSFNYNQYLQELKDHVNTNGLSDVGYQRLHSMKLAVEKFAAENPQYASEMDIVFGNMVMQTYPLKLAFKMDEIGKITDVYKSVYPPDEEIRLYRQTELLLDKVNSSGLKTIIDEASDSFRMMCALAKYNKKMLTRLANYSETVKSSYKAAYEKEKKHLFASGRDKFRKMVEKMRVTTAYKVEIAKCKYSKCPKCDVFFSNVNMLHSNCKHKVCFTCAVKSINENCLCIVCRQPLTSYYRMEIDERTGEKKFVCVTRPYTIEESFEPNYC